MHAWYIVPASCSRSCTWHASGSYLTPVHTVLVSIVIVPPDMIATVWHWHGMAWLMLTGCHTTLATTAATSTPTHRHFFKCCRVPCAAAQQGPLRAKALKLHRHSSKLYHQYYRNTTSYCLTGVTLNVVQAATMQRCMARESAQHSWYAAKQLHRQHTRNSTFASTGKHW